MDLLKGEGEPGSSNETCATSILERNEVISIKAEMVSSMTEEEDGVPRTIPVIKTEPMVSGVPVVHVMHISYRLYPELRPLISVCLCETKI
jgi:hypothetical protein